MSAACVKRNNKIVNGIKICPLGIIRRITGRIPRIQIWYKIRAFGVGTPTVESKTVNFSKFAEIDFPCTLAVFQLNAANLSGIVICRAVIFKIRHGRIESDRIIGRSVRISFISSVPGLDRSLFRFQFCLSCRGIFVSFGKHGCRKKRNAHAQTQNQCKYLLKCFPHGLSSDLCFRTR